MKLTGSVKCGEPDFMVGLWMEAKHSVKFVDCRRAIVVSDIACYHVSMFSYLLAVKRRRFHDDGHSGRGVFMMMAELKT